MRRIFSYLCEIAFSVPFLDKVMRSAEFDHKRVLRRRVEERLRSEGRYPDAVMQGPLKGTCFPPGYASCRFEKIIGVYEAETHPWFEQVITKGGLTSLVNIGAAEGSYAAGLARRLPEIPVFAFEAIEDLHPAIHEMASLNAVAERLHLAGRCELESLRALEVGCHALVICDVEGYEVNLLQPDEVPWLKSATMIVELHDCMIPGSSDLVIGRLKHSHDIHLVSSKGADYSAYPSLAGLSFPEIYAMVLEDRPSPQEWLLAVPKGGN